MNSKNCSQQNSQEKFSTQCFLLCIVKLLLELSDLRIKITFTAAYFLVYLYFLEMTLKYCQIGFSVCFLLTNDTLFLSSSSLLIFPDLHGKFKDWKYKLALIEVFISVSLIEFTVSLALPELKHIVCILNNLCNVLHYPLISHFNVI